MPSQPKLPGWQSCKHLQYTCISQASSGQAGGWVWLEGCSLGSQTETSCYWVSRTLAFGWNVKDPPPSILLECKVSNDADRLSACRYKYHNISAEHQWPKRWWMRLVLTWAHISTMTPAACRQQLRYWPVWNLMSQDPSPTRLPTIMLCGE